MSSITTLIFINLCKLALITSHSRNKQPDHSQVPCAAAILRPLSRAADPWTRVWTSWAHLYVRVGFFQPALHIPGSRVYGFHQPRMEKCFWLWLGVRGWEGLTVRAVLHRFLQGMWAPLGFGICGEAGMRPQWTPRTVGKFWGSHRLHAWLSTVQEWAPPAPHWSRVNCILLLNS